MKRFICLPIVFCFIIGCGTNPAPQPKAFAPLADLQKSGQAMVRIYRAQIPYVGVDVDHNWFVVKEAKSEEFHRWERWITTGPYGFILRDNMDPEHDIGAGDVQIIDELVGPEAEAVVNFIETQSPNYPCRDAPYIVLPGPNSASYIQWVIDETGWKIDVPFSFVGINVRCE